MTLRRTTLVGALLLAFVLTACQTGAPTSTTLSAPTTQIPQAQAVTLTAQVASVPPGMSPTGTVVFRDGTALLATVVAPAGVATFTTSSLAPGAHVLEARFTGGAGWAGSAGTLNVTVIATRYHLALGDSLAFGTGASAGQGYVPLITAAEAARVPGLTLRNVSCSGATTTSMLVGGGCTYPEGNQVAAAEAFLLAHPGKVSFITITIGANDVSGCVSTAGVDAACAAARIPTVQTNLGQILTRLHAAAPGVPIVGMTYYNPFLAYWVFGNQAAATSSNTGAIEFNNALTSTYAAGNALVAPVATAFGTENTALTGTYNGVTVPQNVANICAWTRMCSDSDSHANATGHQLIAATFEPVINAAVPAG